MVFRSPYFLPRGKKKFSAATALFFLVVLTFSEVQAETVARMWNEALLSAIRIDRPAPTVHGRNLYHLSAAMYDAWAAFDASSQGRFFKGKRYAEDLLAARNEAISYAAYRILSDRYSLAADPQASQAIFDGLMETLQYDTEITTALGDSPAALGNRIAALILSATLHDGSNEANAYADNTGYLPVNEPMIVDHPSVTGPGGAELADPNQWQPLYVDSAQTQNGLVGDNLQKYLGPHWGNVDTFALGRDGTAASNSWSAIDPGPPPQFGSNEYTANTVALIRYSSELDPDDGTGTQMVNLSPRVNGNRPLGTHESQGYAENPATGQPYADNFVKRADYARVLAEFWADGPSSETPPGHWNVIANSVSDHPELVKQVGGTGPIVDDLEWDVKLYLALNGAVHDAAVAAWGVKREYNYVRPITMIRHQGSLGQSSDSSAPSYDPEGLPLEADLIELITDQTVGVSGKHHNVYLNANRDKDGNFVQNYTESQLVGKIAVFSWNHEPEDPENEVSGCDWILAENWVPYQRDNFVTPAFAAYVSGHSTFSRAAAEVLSLFTGSEYFPGGLGEKTFEMDDFLVFEKGPSTEVTLQWAKYYDAADEAGISRLHGGIHVSVDDFGGRIMGSSIGKTAYALAKRYFDGSVSTEIAVGNLTAKEIRSVLKNDINPIIRTDEPVVELRRRKAQVSMNTYEITDAGDELGRGIRARALRLRYHVTAKPVGKNRRKRERVTRTSRHSPIQLNLQRGAYRIKYRVEILRGRKRLAKSAFSEFAVVGAD